MNQPNYEVKVDDSQEGAFDVEQVNMTNPPSSPYLEDEDGNGNSFGSVKDAAEDSEAPPSSSSRNEDDNGSSFVSNCSSSWWRKGIIGVFVGTAIAAIVGLSVHSARNVQQQKSISMLSGGKAGKAPEGPPYCPSRARTCGETFTGGKVTLFEDLICNELEAVPPPTIPNGANCAMTLDGDAELDCKGYMISQATPADNGSDSAVKCVTTTGGAFAQKNACQLYYYRGICLKNGAKAKNCHVQKFLDGIFVENGGEIKDSMVTRNRRGIFVLDEISGSSTKISKTTVQENASGIEVSAKSSGNKISIDKVRSNNNVGLDGNLSSGDGMQLYGEEIVVKDSEASGNHRIGIIIDGKGDTSVDLKGSITLRNNKQDGLTVDRINGNTLSGVLNVDGVVDTYFNGRDGFRMNQDTALNVEVKKGSSLNACQNEKKDIRNGGDGSYGNDGFTCDTKAVASGKDQPDCASCPECPAP